MKNKIITYSHQTIDQKDIRLVIKTLQSSYLTQGQKIQEFERALQNYVKSKYAIVVNSGTAALHCACYAINLKSGDEVITSPLSFVATANSILYCNAKPVFADVDESGLLDPKLAEKAITNKTKAIITVDYAGQPSYISAVKKICNKYKLILIEDAAHSLGGFYKNKPVGSLADITCFSFHPVKSITTGEGGAITTNNHNYYEKIIQFRSHGIVKEANKFIYKNDDPWYYEMHNLGYNFRLTDIQAALGISQLQKLDRFIKTRREIALFYNVNLRDLEKKGLVKLPAERRGIQSAWHLYPLRVDFRKIRFTRKELFNKFKSYGINLQVHYIPIHFQPYYRQKYNYKKGCYPNTELFYEQEISLPLYPSMKEKEIRLVVATVKKYLQ